MPKVPVSAMKFESYPAARLFTDVHPDVIQEIARQQAELFS